MTTDTDSEPFEVQCHHCHWKGYRTDLVKMYTDAPGEGVDKLVACPSCRQWDELEEK